MLEGGGEEGVLINCGLVSCAKLEINWHSLQTRGVQAAGAPFAWGGGWEGITFPSFVDILVRIQIQIRIRILYCSLWLSRSQQKTSF
jgi:hypothetical protein